MIPPKLKRVAALLWFLTFLCLADIFYARPPEVPGLMPREKRGKQIYLQGTSPSDHQILAVLEDSALDMPASAFACVSCHGFDGKGKPEGGVVPSDITWDALTKSYGVKHATGREHPPYTERSLGMAIMAGRDPAGNKLLGIMPRYRMSREDLADLIAYIKRVGKDLDPGITGTSLRIGTILPPAGMMTGLGEAIRAVLSAYFEDINSEGGIYNRKLELMVAEPASTGAATVEAAARHLVDEDQVFGMSGAFIAGADKELAGYLGEREVPLIGPFTLKPQASFPLNRYVFYLFSGIDAQARVLMDFLFDRLRYEKPRVAVVYPENDLVQSAAEQIADRDKASERNLVTKLKYSSGKFNALSVCQQLSDSGTNVVFFFGSSPESVEFMAQARKLNWIPTLLLPGSLVSKEIFDAPLEFKKKLYLAFPTLLSDQTAKGEAEFTEFANRHRLPARHLAAQLATYCSAKILVEGLKLAGKDVSREKLIIALEGMYGFETGLTPKISYGPNRRVGAWGGYVVTVDPEKKEFVLANDWVTLH